MSSSRDSSGRDLAALCIQSAVRAHLARQKVQQARSSRTTNFLMTRKYEQALRIQLAWKGYIARSCVSILAGLRQFKYVQLIYSGAALCIQSAWRTHIARSCVRAHREHRQATLTELLKKEAGEVTTFLLSLSADQTSPFDPLMGGGQPSQAQQQRRGMDDRAIENWIGHSSSPSSMDGAVRQASTAATTLPATETTVSMNGLAIDYDGDRSISHHDRNLSSLVSVDDSGDFGDDEHSDQSVGGEGLDGAGTDFEELPARPGKQPVQGRPPHPPKPRKESKGKGRVDENRRPDWRELEAENNAEDGDDGDYSSSSTNDYQPRGVSPPDSEAAKWWTSTEQGPPLQAIMEGMYMQMDNEDFGGVITDAATAIQSLFRGHLARRQYPGKTMSEKPSTQLPRKSVSKRGPSPPSKGPLAYHHLAARTIQSAWRSARARQLRREKERARVTVFVAELIGERDHAVKKIQRWFRALRRNRAARRITKFFRHVCALNQIAKRRQRRDRKVASTVNRVRIRSAKIIQAAFRNYAAVRRFEAFRHRQATRIQALFRGYACRQSGLVRDWQLSRSQQYQTVLWRSEQAARIQAIFRGFRVRMHLRKLREQTRLSILNAVSLVQSVCLARVHRIQNAQRLLIHRVTVIQQIARSCHDMLQIHARSQKTTQLQSVVVVQQMFRAKIAEQSGQRKQQQHAVVPKLQRWVRLCLARKRTKKARELREARYQWLCRNEAVTVIQRCYAAHRIHRSFKETLALKREALQKSAEWDSKHVAALEIQRVARSKLGRTHGILHRKARQIQVAWHLHQLQKMRQKLAVKKSIARIEEMRNEGATAIQKVFRGHRCRIEYRRKCAAVAHMNESALAIQLAWRSFLARRTAEQLAVQKCQKRMTAEYLHSALVVQKYFRGWKIKQETRKQWRLTIRVADIIARFWRSARSRVARADRHERLRAPKPFFRRWGAGPPIEFHEASAAAKDIQRVYRGFRDRLWVNQLRTERSKQRTQDRRYQWNIRLLQCVGRGHKVRTEFSAKFYRWQAAAMLIQRHIRGFLGRRKARNHALFKVQLAAVLVIQKYVRPFLVSLHLGREERAMRAHAREVAIRILVSEESTARQAVLVEERLERHMVVEQKENAEMKLKEIMEKQTRAQEAVAALEEMLLKTPTSTTSSGSKSKSYGSSAAAAMEIAAKGNEGLILGDWLRWLHFEVANQIDPSMMAHFEKLFSQCASLRRSVLRAEHKAWKDLLDRADQKRFLAQIRGEDPEFNAAWFSEQQTDISKTLEMKRRLLQDAKSHYSVDYIRFCMDLDVYNKEDAVGEKEAPETPKLLITDGKPVLGTPVQNTTFRFDMADVMKAEWEIAKEATQTKSKNLSDLMSTVKQPQFSANTPSANSMDGSIRRGAQRSLPAISAGAPSPADYHRMGVAGAGAGTVASIQPMESTLMVVNQAIQAAESTGRLDLCGVHMDDAVLHQVLTSRLTFPPHNERGSSTSRLVTNNISELHLSNNRLTDVGGIELANMLQHNTSLRVVLLDGNRGLTDLTARHLLNALKSNTTLRELVVGPNTAISLSLATQITYLLCSADPHKPVLCYRNTARPTLGIVAPPEEPAAQPPTPRAIAIGAIQQKRSALLSGLSTANSNSLDGSKIFTRVTDVADATPPTTSTTGQQLERQSIRALAAQNRTTATSDGTNGGAEMLLLQSFNGSGMST